MSVTLAGILCSDICDALQGKGGAPQRNLLTPNDSDVKHFGNVELNQSTFDAAFLNGHPSEFYREDCRRIQRYAWTLGIILTRWQAYEIWSSYSGERCAQWLMRISASTVQTALQEFVDSRLNQK